MVGSGRRKPICKAPRRKVMIYWTFRRQTGGCPGWLGRWSCHSQEERYERRARPEAWLMSLLHQTALLFFFPNIPQSLFLPGICKDCVPSLFLHLRGLCFLSFPWVIPPQVSGLGFNVITSMVSTTPGRSGCCSLLLLSLLPSFISFNFFFLLCLPH